MPKFFVNDEQIINEKITIIGEDVNHISKVLRMKKSDKIQVCNKSNKENYIVEIIKFQKDEIECEIKEKILNSTEPNTQITIYQGLPKFDKMEYIIQKNVEIGVNSIVPVKMDRSIVKLNEKDGLKKIDRWQKISEIAAKQSMRDIIPKIENLKKFNEIIKEFEKYDIVIVAYENEYNLTLKKSLEKIEKDNQKIAILIGPEGGISKNEIDILSKIENIKIVTLGKRILRTETAGLVLTSNILYELEN